MEDLLEKSISILIEKQFPEWYRQEGPLFVAFVREYYKWLESRSPRKLKYIRQDKAKVALTYNSPNVVGSNTLFLENFSNGDYIAIDKQTEDDDYELFTIDVVSNNTFLTLTNNKLPQFAFTNTSYGTVNTYGNPLYYSRRMLDIIDVDDTLEEFLIYFKQQFLNDIQFETITDTRTLVKHALDIYRSKGTERSVDLLFRIVYGVAADIYYPSSDLFRASSGTWFKPKYLELSPGDNTHLYVEKQITGVKSGATAFVESVIRKTVAGKIIDVAFISAINGNFRYGEKIFAETLPDISIEDAPYITGSLNDISIATTGVGTGFNVGDTLQVESEYGRQALARVVNTTNTTGDLSIELINGGYGYTANTVPVISDKVLTLENVQVNVSSTQYKNEYFNSEFTVFQPYANVAYVNANGTPEVGDLAFSYAGLGPVGRGIVMDVTELSATAGYAKIAVYEGDLTVSNAIYFNANAIGANISNYQDLTATANVVGYNANVILSVENVFGTFTPDEAVTGLTSSANGRLIVDGIFGTSGIISLADTSGTYLLGETITGKTSGANAVISGVSIAIGIKDQTNTLITTNNNFLYSSIANGTVKSISEGSGLNFAFSNNLAYSEEVDIANDILQDYAAIRLDAPAYGFPADPTGNLTSNSIGNLLSFTTWNIGKLQIITSFNPGSGYNVLPIIKIKEDFITKFNIRGQEELRIANATSTFTVGEIVTQESTDAKGIVVSANLNSVIVERLRFSDDDNFKATVNANHQLVGTDSATTANITSVSAVSSSQFIGNNAVLEYTISSAVGAVTNLQIIDSGFGYVQNESLRIFNDSSELTGFAVLDKHGTASGFYYDTGGFLSDNKKLFDGIYWQEYSYEIRSSVQLNRYADMLKNVVHVAGTQFFGNLVYSSVINSNAREVETVVKQFDSDQTEFGNLIITVAYTEINDTLDGYVTENQLIVQITDDNDTLSASMQSFYNAVLEITEDDEILEGVVFDFDGRTDFTEEAETLTSAVSVPIDATATITESVDTLDSLIPQITITASITESDDTLESLAIAEEGIIATITEADDTLDSIAGAFVPAVNLVTQFIMTNTNFTGSSGNEYTWQNVTVGTAAADRLVIVALGSTAGANSSATDRPYIRINNEDMKLYTNAIFNSGFSAIAYKLVPAGTTANIAVYTGNFRNYEEGGGAVFTIRGAHTEPVDIFTTVDNFTDRADLSYRINANGGAVAVSTIVANANPTWNGFIERSHANSGTDMSISTASIIPTGSGNPVTANVVWDQTDRLSTALIAFDSYLPTRVYATGFIDDNTDTLSSAVDMPLGATSAVTEESDTLEAVASDNSVTITAEITEADDTADSSIINTVVFRVGLGLGTTLDGGTVQGVMPATIEAGDLLIAAGFNREHDDDGTMSDNSGGNTWTKLNHASLPTAPGTSANSRLVVYYKEAVAGDAGATLSYEPTTSSDTGALSMAVFYNANTTAILNVATKTGANNTDNDISGFTPTESSGYVVVAIGSQDNVDVGPVSATDPATISELDVHLNPAGWDCLSGIYGSLKTNTNDTGTISWTDTDDKQCAIRFYIQPL